MKKTNYKNQLDKCVELLAQMMSQADEDTPHECRTRHFEETMLEAHDFITEYRKSNK